MIGNSTAYRRYLRKVGAKVAHSFGVDAGKLAEEARFDGIFVLRTNAKVTPLQAVLRYRDLLAHRGPITPPDQGDHAYTAAADLRRLRPTPPSAAMSSARVPGARDAKASWRSPAPDRSRSGMEGPTFAISSTASPRRAPSGIAKPTGSCTQTLLPP